MLRFTDSKCLKSDFDANFLPGKNCSSEQTSLRGLWYCLWEKGEPKPANRLVENPLRQIVQGLFHKMRAKNRKKTKAGMSCSPCLLWKKLFAETWLVLHVEGTVGGSSGCGIGSNLFTSSSSWLALTSERPRSLRLTLGWEERTATPGYFHLSNDSCESNQAGSK